MAGFSSALHPRVPAGSSAGGQFGTRAAAKAGAAKAKPPTKKAAGRKPVPPAAKGKAPQKPGRSGQYSKTQFAQLQSLQRQHARGRRLTAMQAKALHTAHVLHLAHVRRKG